MKQSKTTLKELTHRYRAVLLKCALLNLAAFAVALPASAADIVIGDGDTVIYTRISEDGEGNRYTIKVNDNAEEFFNFSPAVLKMTGGNLIVESNVGYWLDWQGTGGVDISGGTVSAKKEETLSTYRSTLSISGNAVINTALMSDVGTTISGGKITLADTEDDNNELYFGKGLGIDAADEETSGTLSISGGDITLGKNRRIVLIREWGDLDTENVPSSYRGDINISGGNITLNKNAQIIRTDSDNNKVNGTLVFNYLKDSRPNELSKTTGEINISGGTITLNDTASIVNHSSDGTIRISDKAIINVNGNNRFENAKGIATADFTGGTINLNGTLTADINATGGAISFNNNSALNGKITGQLNKLTIAGGTFNDGNKLVIDGSEDITVSGGTIISNNRGAVLQHQGTGNIVVTGGTFNNNTDHEANDIVHLGSGDIKISGGTFNNSVIYKPVSCANGYGYETCSGSSTTPVAGKIEISGGVFNNAELNSDSTEGISISNGTFGDSSIAANNGDLIITGGSFKDNDLEGKNITIDSDKADLTLNAGKLLHSIDASRLTITGEKGISIAKTVVKSDDISGKIIANKDSFVGGFTEPLIRWNVSGTVLPTVQNSELTARNLTVNEAKIVLNADAKAGIGMIDWNPTADANGNYANGNVSYSYSKSLSDNEINTAVKMVADKILKIEATTKNIDDLGLAFNDALEAANVDGLPDSQYIEQQWKQGKSVDIDKIKTALREAYNNYNKFISESSAQVNIAKSEITMNGTAGLVNGSAKDGNIVVSDNSTVVANGTNEILAKSGTVSFADSKLVVSNGANLTVATKDGNTLNLTNGTVDLSGVLNGNVSGGTLAVNSANARLNGKIANTGVEINTDIGFSALPTGLTTLKIATGKTLDIGENSLTASTIAGGTISAILTDAAKNTAIVTATATDVTLKLDMSQASRDKATRYKITNGTGFTFGDYAANRYAVSASEFDKTNAKTLEKLSGWNGGDLWILRLATASEAAIEDLEKSGVVLPENEKNASKILDLASGILDKLPEHRKKVIEKVNDLLDKAQGKAEEIKQILREIAPDASTSGSKTASNTAKSVINVINSRFGGGLPRRGRSGGDYTAGQTAVWAQGMMNYAKLDTDNGFAAHSNGVAAGFEANFTDSFKAGLGYAYTSTDISTERSTTDVKTHTGFVYGEYKPNKAYINGVVSFGRSDYDDTTRSLSLNSAYKTDTIAAQIAAGYKAGVLTPEAAVRFTNVKQKAYTDALGAKMEEKTADTWTGVLGAKIGQNYVLEANRKIGLSPELKVAATYDFARDDENRTVTLPDGSSYTATGEAMERFGVEAGAGVTVSIANSAEIALTYDGKFKKDYQDHTGMVNLKIKF